MGGGGRGCGRRGRALRRCRRVRHLPQRALLYRLRPPPRVRVRRSAAARAAARGSDAIGRHSSLASSASGRARCNLSRAGHRRVRAIPRREHARSLACGRSRSRRNAGDGDDCDALDSDLRTDRVHRDRVFRCPRARARRTARVLVGWSDCGRRVRSQIRCLVLGARACDRHRDRRTALGFSVARLLDRRADCRGHRSAERRMAGRAWFPIPRARPQRQCRQLHRRPNPIHHHPGPLGERRACAALGDGHRRTVCIGTTRAVAISIDRLRRNGALYSGHPRQELLSRRGLSDDVCARCCSVHEAAVRCWSPRGRFWPPRTARSRFRWFYRCFRRIDWSECSIA